MLVIPENIPSKSQRTDVAFVLVLENNIKLPEGTTESAAAGDMLAFTPQLFTCAKIPVNSNENKISKKSFNQAGLGVSQFINQQR